MLVLVDVIHDIYLQVPPKRKKIRMQRVQEKNQRQKLWIARAKRAEIKFFTHQYLYISE